jgi:arylsulfatase A-like enzyme
VAGVPVPKGKQLDGENLLPLLTETGAIPDRAIYWHFPIYLQGGEPGAGYHDPLFRTRPGSALRIGKWKFHEYFEDSRMELYDLESAPGERTNIAATHPEKTAELHQLMKQWRAELNAPVPTELNPEYNPNSNSRGNKK